MAKSKFPAELAKCALGALVESFASAAGGLIAERWLAKKDEVPEKPVTEALANVQPTGNPNDKGTPQ